MVETSNVYQLADEIEVAARDLNILVADKGYDFEPLRTQLIRALSSIEKCKNYIQMRNARLKDFNKI